MFEFKNKDVKVAHINIREEKHEDDPVLAVDVKLKGDMPNPALDKLAPGLLVSLYGATEEQEELFEGAPLTKLRYPAMGVITWAMSPLDVAITFHRVTKDVRVVGTIKALKMVPKDGGTVEVTFTVQSTPEPDLVGQLSGMLGTDQESTLELLAPKEPAAGTAKSLEDVFESPDPDTEYVTGDEDK